ncbi:MAG: hypothetical protein RL074_484 [Bacteroidota bacterium]
MANLIFIGSIFLVFVTIYMLLFTKNAAKSYSDYVLSFLLKLKKRDSKTISLFTNKIQQQLIASFMLGITSLHFQRK